MILTVAAVSCAVINFQQQSRYHLPDDGAVWVDRVVDGQPAVVALTIQPAGPAERAGIHTGDVLVAIDSHRIRKETEVPQALALAGPWSKAVYSLRRGPFDLPANVYVGEHVVDSSVYYQYVVGLAYLLIGLFVYYRRGGASHRFIFTFSA